MGINLPITRCSRFFTRSCWHNFAGMTCAFWPKKKNETKNHSKDYKTMDMSKLS